MSVASEITRIQNAKASIKSSIENKGVSVPSNALIDTYSTYIDAISGGGGGGLTYEEGTYTPTEDIARPTIKFSKTYSEPPVYVALYDSTGTYDGTTNTSVGFSYNDFWRWNGNNSMYSGTSTQRYVMIHYMYRGTNASSFSSGTQQIAYNSDYTSDASNSYPRYWVQLDGFKPYTMSSSRYWRAGRTYKWIAVWK